MIIKFTLVTNTKGTLNKTFSLDATGQLKKEANAFLSKGVAEIRQVYSLTEFYYVLQNLKANQAIILGVIDEQNL